MRLTDKKVVIVGGGKIALRKAKTLQGTGAHVTVVSPKILDELKVLPYITWQNKRFEAADIQEAQLIFAATDDKEINRLVCDSANAFQWVNDISASENSNFMTPAIVRRGDLILTVSTSGTSPVFAKKIKRELEERYDDDIIEELAVYKTRRAATVDPYL